MGGIINSTFINNRARVGDAIYNYGYDGTIDRCIFVNNTANSMIYGGDYATMVIKNSIIVNNYGNDLVGDQNPIMDNNWWGTTADDEEAPVISGQTLTNYYILNMTVDDDSADITLNNAYYKSSNSTGIVSNYSLPEIALNLYPVNLRLSTSNVTLDGTGKAIVYYTKTSEDAKLTASNEYVSLSRNVCDFDILQSLINENDEIELNRNFTYGNGDSLTEGISINKSVAIDGNGHTIDANHQARIFKVTSGTVTLKNINFINGYADSGAAMY